MAGEWHVSASEDRAVLSDWIRSLCAELEIDKPAQAFVVLRDALHAIRVFVVRQKLRADEEGAAGVSSFRDFLKATVDA